MSLTSTILGILAALGTPQAPPTDAPVSCEALVGKTAAVEVTGATVLTPEPAVTIETASFYKPHPVTVPFCRVQGVIEGSIGFELWLPETWNGRMLGAGVGGDAGIFNYADMSLRIGQGFATVSTDTGHKDDEAHWMLDPKKRADYEHRAVHLTAQAARDLIERHYGKPAQRAYFTGCSGGGRQAMKEMQLYPQDYDGILAGAPAPYMPLQSVRMLWFSLMQQQRPEAALRDADWSLYERAVTKQCDAIDGVLDGIVENPARCTFDTAVLQCKAGQSEGCIPAKRLAMLNTIVAPMRDATGARMDDGLFPGVRTRPGPPSPLLRSMWADGVYGDPEWDERSFQQVPALALANRRMPQLRADSTDIGGFLERGGKAIIYQGWQDPSTNAGLALDYYADLAAARGDAETLAQSVRMFMVPGMYHCGGGPGVDLFGGSTHAPLSNGADPSRDMLWALIDWVERDRAPQSIVGARNVPGGAGFTRRLCPFPQAAVYDGTGPQREAASYRCELDPVLANMLPG